jgi:hyperosmotically inducible protein
MRTALLCVLALIGVSGCASPDSKRDGASGNSAESSPSSVERYMDDAAITAKVKAELVKDVGAKPATEVTVTTENGVVQLAGFVSSRDDADRAVAAAREVAGVRDVKDDIRLK